MSTLITQSISGFAKQSGLPQSSFVKLDGSEEISSEFFSAHKIVDGGVLLDMKAAKEIKMDQLRLKRDEKLKKLDTEYIIALEVGDEDGKKEIALEKKNLRDMPNDPAFAKITTLAALKDYQPKILKDVVK